MKARNKTFSARETAFLILLEFVTRTTRLDDLVSQAFNANIHSDRDKKMITTLTHGVVKNLSLLDWRLSSLYHGDWNKALHKLKTILRLAAYEVDFLDFIPPHATINEYVNLAKKKLTEKAGGTINGIMRNYLRQRKQLDPEKKFKYPATQIELKYSIPKWLVTRWLDLWGAEHTEKMCAMFNAKPIFDLKININRIRMDAFEKILVENGIKFSYSDYFPDIVKLHDIQKIKNLKLFQEGYCIVQDESARLAVEMLELVPGDRVLDACAAPGGKLNVMRQLLPDRISMIGLDVDERRISLMRDHCAADSGSKCYRVCGDGRTPPFKVTFDKILVDAPCSGFGTLQKNPDIKWRRKPEDINIFQKLQIEILTGVSQLLSDHGLLVYSTCTIDPSENEEVIAGFLNEQQGKFMTIKPPEFLSGFQGKGNAIRTFPHIHQMDGAFAVRIIRSREF